ncbi:MAG: hypothetical protein WCO13_13230 [Bacteroidota bacterium]
MIKIITKILLFSEYFTPIAKKIAFIAIILFRFILILFRRNKTIKVIQLQYSRKFQFENSYLIINYRFRNALWYKFSSIGNTLNKNNVIFDLSNISDASIKLKVYGFFRSESFEFDISKENKLFAERFKTKINVNKLQPFTNPLNLSNKSFNLISKNVYFNRLPFNFNFRILQKREVLKINHSNFIKNEFI